MKLPSIQDIPGLSDKRVLVRVDWSDHDAFRIESSQSTIKYLQNTGAKIVIATHDDFGKEEELKKFVPEGAEFLPNLRENPGEESNSLEFAKQLARRADLYVNEAFSVSHREHASIVNLPKLIPGFTGFQFQREVENLSRAFNPPRSFLLILGGAKFETKVPLVKKFLNIADEIFIAGTNAMPASESDLKNNPKISFPHGDLSALDVDEETIENLKFVIRNSQFILWNGPLGKYEDEKYQWGTKELAKILAESGKDVIVGGGDTLSAIKELSLYDKFSFVSTGGGAMLQFLANGTLPGIEALKSSKEI